jgi:thioredoxin 1
MKKNFGLHFLFIASLTSSYCISTTSQPLQNLLAQYGLQYGIVNHLGSMNSFDQSVASGAQIFVKIGASWCPPCQKLSPIIVQLASEFNSILFIEVNFDSFQELANRYGVRSIPTVLLFKNGTHINRTVGFKDKSFWAELIRSSFTF